MFVFIQCVPPPNVHFCKLVFCLLTLLLLVLFSFKLMHHLKPFTIVVFNGEITVYSVDSPNVLNAMFVREVCNPSTLKIFKDVSLRYLPVHQKFCLSFFVFIESKENKCFKNEVFFNFLILHLFCLFFVLHPLYDSQISFQ